MAEQDPIRKAPRKTGRPRRREAVETRTVTADLPEETARRLHRYSYDHKTTKGRVIADALQAYFAGYVSPRMPAETREDGAAA